MNNKRWNHSNNPPEGKMVWVKITHCNKDLKLDDEYVKGQMKDDGFYLDDGGELSFNWDIIAWSKDL